MPEKPMQRFYVPTQQLNTKNVSGALGNETVCVVTESDHLAVVKDLKDELITVYRKLADARVEERERCAKVCDEVMQSYKDKYTKSGHIMHATGRASAYVCSQLIRQLPDEEERKDGM